MIAEKAANAGASDAGSVREVLEIEDDASTEAGDDVFTFHPESRSTAGASRSATAGRKKEGAASAATSARGR